MNKGQLIEAIAERLETTKKSAADALDAVLDEIVAQVAAGEKIALSGFGNFEPIYRPARTARNPRTGDEVQVAASVTPKFKPGATFKDAVNA